MDFIWNIKTFIQENVFEIVVREMLVHLVQASSVSRP